MGVIEEVEHSDVQYLSPIFTVPKKDGEYRMVLNLKDLNLDIQYYHFKMETFETALKLIKLNSYMASIDIRHAYYSVPIAVEHKQFLCFKWKGTFFSLYLPSEWNKLCTKVLYQIAETCICHSKTIRSYQYGLY